MITWMTEKIGLAPTVIILSLLLGGLFTVFMQTKDSGFPLGNKIKGVGKWIPLIPGAIKGAYYYFILGWAPEKIDEVLQKGRDKIDEVKEDVAEAVEDVAEAVEDVSEAPESKGIVSSADANKTVPPVVTTNTSDAYQIAMNKSRDVAKNIEEADHEGRAIASASTTSHRVL
jgi:hypothetical protein